MGLVADARSRVATALSAMTRTGLLVQAYPRMVDQPVGELATVMVDRVDPADVACPDTKVTCLVYLVVPITEPSQAWDQLDDLLDDALAALRVARGVTWTQVETAVWADTHPAYRMTVEVTG